METRIAILMNTRFGPLLSIALLTGSFLLPAVNASADCVAPPPGLVGWWPGESNANDIVGDHNGTLLGPVSFSAGEVGQSFVLNGSNSTNSKLVYGTGTNCGTGLVSLTPAFALAFGTSVSAGGGLGYLIKVPAGNALCVNNSSSSGVNVLVSYTMF